ncbi:DNA cytosine methyltransferase [Mycolicibacterium sp. CH28]|uniref:DNA cytosine methyltransferase n=1 Tax=Mycolicibacterium sp. CH28 TaxID=2512237 RepID=UPI00108201DC|nr:DNA cytosine methyltransferase [Mycolicibacterium sp. CH28]TGD87423.1 DNA cytosine methyltransferase [Mycolicibacterium sp. CH28]
MNSRPTAIDLFSGAGGGGLGLTQAGFDLRWSVDLDPDAARTHQRHLPGATVTGDIRALSDAALAQSVGMAPGELDLLFAGPPCQGFSMIGQRKIADLRNTLYREVIRATAVFKPKVVVIENVPGLLTLAGGSYLASILAGLEDLGAQGYRTACAELLAAQYGAPQMRWRLVIIAWRDDLGIPPGYGFPEPTHGDSAIGDLVSNVTIPQRSYKGLLTTRAAIGDLPALEAGETVSNYGGNPRYRFQKVARTLPNGRRMNSSELHDHYAAALGETTLNRLRHLKPGEDWRDLPHELLPGSMQRALRKDHTRRYRRMDWDGVPRAIITRFRDPKSGEYTHPEQHRTISIREAARIQGFPDWFSFAGSTTSKYVQVGNAIPVPLAKAIAAEIISCLAGVPAGTRLVEPFRRRPIPFIGQHGELTERIAA